jgi:hypothetical protein
LSSPLGFAAYFLFHRESRKAQASPSTHHLPQTTGSIADQNLAFALLAAFSGGSACVCRTALRVQSSNAVFLAVSRHRIAGEIRALEQLGFVEATRNGSCDCSAEFAMSQAGLDALNNSLEYTRHLGLLPSSATPRGRGSA